MSTLAVMDITVSSASVHVCIVHARVHQSTYLYDAILSKKSSLADKPKALAVSTYSLQHLKLTPDHKKHFVTDFALQSSS